MKVIQKASPIQGTSVFAADDIPKGAPVLKADDSRLVHPDQPLDESNGEFERHCRYLAGGKVVLMKPPERHINHGGDPDTFVRTINGVRYVFALRDICAGEKITRITASTAAGRSSGSATAIVGDTPQTDSCGFLPVTIRSANRIPVPAE